MQDTKRRIDIRRRNLEDLIVLVLTRAHETERDPSCDYGDRFRICAQFLQRANHELWMANLSLNGKVKNAD
mgnify:FL=1